MYALNIAIILILVLLEGHQSKCNAPTSSSERPKPTEEQPLSPSPSPSSQSSFLSTFPKRPSPFDPNIVGKKKVDIIIEEKKEVIEVWTCKYCKEKNEANSKHCYFCSFKNSSKRFHPAIKSSSSIGKCRLSETNSSAPIENGNPIQPTSTENNSNNSSIDPLANQQLKEAISNDNKPELQSIEASKQSCRGLCERGTLLLGKKVKKTIHKRIRISHQKKILLLWNKFKSFDYEADVEEDEEQEDAQSESDLDEQEEINQEGGSEDDEDSSIEEDSDDDQ